jgi:hypothetical protein
MVRPCVASGFYRAGGKRSRINVFGLRLEHLLRTIVETGNDSWRFKSRDDDHAARARTVSATPTSSDGASATAKTRRPKGSKLDADTGSNLNAD